tara:strand:+ start:124 stop:1035 length:912 start_codon:yes stop_codon:yes gene_type:complete
MAQHDYVIANQTFPNTRTDLNNALSAIVTNNSGSSAPSTTYAYQIWYDTSANKLYMRNSANDANITLAEFDQTNDTVEYYTSDSIRTALIEFTDGDDAITITDTGLCAFAQKITADAGIDIDNINIDGTTIALSSGDLTLDAAGDIVLDAGGDEIILKDGSTNVGHFSLDSDNLTIKTLVGDKDFIIKGVDGSSEITALTIDMSAAGAATFNNDVTAFSDERLKTNIATIENALEKVCNMRGVTFDREGKKGTGVIAQEMQKVMPEVVHDKNEYLSVAYGNLVGVLIEAVKELKAEVEELKKG